MFYYFADTNEETVILSDMPEIENKEWKVSSLSTVDKNNNANSATIYGWGWNVHRLWDMKRSKDWMITKV